MENILLPQNKQWIKWTHTDPNRKDFLAINWLLTNACNYRCSYCDEHIHDGSIPPLDKEVIKDFIKAITQKIAPKKVFFEFNGGEVTYYPGIEELFKTIKDSNSFCGIISNGSRPLKWWKENLVFLDSILLSFHHEFSDRDHFLNLLELIGSHPKIKIHINIMMDPKNFDFCLETARIFKRHSTASLSLQRLLENHNKENESLYPYSEEQKLQMAQIKSEKFIGRSLKMIFKSSPIEFRGLMKKVYADKKEEATPADYLITNGESRFKNWSCMAGVENLAIDWDGKIYRGQCQEGGSLGQVGQDFDPNLVKPILCQRDFCYCGFDLLCEKKLIV